MKRQMLLKVEEYSDQETVNRLLSRGWTINSFHSSDVAGGGGLFGRDVKEGSFYVILEYVINEKDDICYNCEHFELIYGSLRGSCENETSPHRHGAWISDTCSKYKRPTSIN